MTRLVMYSWRAFLVLIGFISVTLPALAAQGQSPDSPLVQPGYGDSSGMSSPPGPRGSGSTLGSSRRRGTSGQSGQQSGLSGRRHRGDQRGQSAEKPAAEKNAEKDKPKEKAAASQEKGAKVVTGGAAGAAGAKGKTPPAGTTAPPAGAPAAAKNAKPAGAAGAAPAMPGGKAAPGGGTAQGAFEPVFEREPEYGAVPDDGDPLTFTDGQMPLNEFLSAINLATNWNIIVSEELKDITLHFWISEVKPKAALEILKFHKIFYTFDKANNYLYVMSEEEWLDKTFGKLKSRDFEVQHADVAYVESVISSLLSSKGRIITDQRTGHIYVWDTKDNLEQMAKTFDEIDVPLAKETFTVQHADVNDIQSTLNTLLTANGKLLTDTRTAQIIVWDTPAALAHMKNTVEELDVPLETRRYDLVYANAEDATDSLQALLSERGLLQIDPRFNSVLATDLPSRLKRLDEAVKTLDRELETRTWTINYADVDFIADQLETQVPSEMGEVVVNDEAHQITVTGLTERLDHVAKLIKTWDVKRRQVNIEAYIVEVGAEVEHQFNVNWSYFGMAGMAPVTVKGGSGFDAAGAGNVNIGQLPYNVPAFGGLTLDSTGAITRPALTNTDGKPVVADVRGNNIGVTLSYLDSLNKATLLASPRVTVQDGEEASFENARRVPFISSSSYFGSSYLQNGVNNNPNNNLAYQPNNTNRVEFIDVGTILDVTPRITEDDNIIMDIAAEDSDAVQVKVTSNGQDSTIPEKTTRRAETQLQVHSGETVVLGGLRKNHSERVQTKMPILADIPLIGRLFRYPNDKSGNRTLLIFLTPTIVDEFTYGEADMLAKADERIAKDLRHDIKDIWGRWRDKMRKGRNEVSVAVGQSGTIHTEGKRVSAAELRDAFFALKDAPKVSVVLRRHPNAPKETIAAVTDAAMEAGLKIEFDDRVIPLVPAPMPRLDGIPRNPAPEPSGAKTSQPGDPKVTTITPGAVERPKEASAAKPKTKAEKKKEAKEKAKAEAKAKSKPKDEGAKPEKSETKAKPAGEEKSKPVSGQELILAPPAKVEVPTTPLSAPETPPAPPAQPAPMPSAPAPPAQPSPAPSAPVAPAPDQATPPAPPAPAPAPMPAPAPASKQPVVETPVVKPVPAQPAPVQTVPPAPTPAPATPPAAATPPAQPAQAPPAAKPAAPTDPAKPTRMPTGRRKKDAAAAPPAAAPANPAPTAIAPATPSE